MNKIQDSDYRFEYKEESIQEDERFFLKELLMKL